jgi:Ca-activated chloride channel family protein
MIAIYWWMRPQTQNDWLNYADSRLVKWLQIQTPHQSWRLTWLCLFLSLIMMVIGLSGPSWHQYPKTLTQLQKPVVVVMDLSRQMLIDDISPSRLRRAKFFIEDLLKSHADLQWGLLVFSQTAFLVSPLTNDSQNILSFLPALEPGLMPIDGYNVTKAITKAQEMLMSSGERYGKILVISSQRPEPSLLALNQKGYNLFWVLDASFPAKPPKLGWMQVMNIKDSAKSLNAWLSSENLGQTKVADLNSKVMQWRDEGRWFVLLAMVFLLGVFRKGWFLRLWI